MITITETHQFIYQDGYKVCLNCGLSEKSHYFREMNYQEIEGERKKKEKKVRKDTGDKAKWTRLKRLEKWTNNNTNIKNVIFYLTNSIREYLTHSQAHFFMNTLKQNNLKNTREVFIHAYKIIVKYDLPILTEQYNEIVKKWNKHQRWFYIHQHIKNLDYIRAYYWLINKVLNECKNLSDKEKMSCYKLTLNYYRLIRFCMKKSYKPTNLIKALIYYSIKQEAHNKKYTQQDLSLVPYHIAKIKNIFKEIKQKELDKQIPHKLSLHGNKE